MCSSIARRIHAAILFCSLIPGLTWAQAPLPPKSPVAAPPQAAVAPERPGAGAPAGRRAAAALSGVVNINTATAEELVLLPGVGPAKAKAILAYRQEKGPFRKLEELAEVKGIGPRYLERMRPFCTLDGKTTARRAGP